MFELIVFGESLEASLRAFHPTSLAAEREKYHGGSRVWLISSGERNSLSVSPHSQRTLQMKEEEKEKKNPADLIHSSVVLTHPIPNPLWPTSFE